MRQLRSDTAGCAEDTGADSVADDYGDAKADAENAQESAATRSR